jgi:hypothetical protein
MSFSGFAEDFFDEKKLVLLCQILYNGNKKVSDFLVFQGKESKERQGDTNGLYGKKEMGLFCIAIYLYEIFRGR